MNNSEILKIIKVKELEIKKIQLEIDKWKKQFYEITTNSSEDLPHTGIDKTDFNVAMILLLALVLSMFSLVQYRKISKKDE